MTLKEFQSTHGKYFIAMEYYWLILNRTYLILLAETCLIGIQANGLVSADGSDTLARAIVKNIIIKGNLENPHSYIKGKYVSKIAEVDLFSENFLINNRFNFRIDYTDIIDVTYSPKKKWGMGYYPHDGKVYVKNKNGKTREFIILGNQSGNSIKDWVQKKLNS